VMESNNGRIGASFADFLDEQGIREEVEGQAVKELIAEQISAAMKEEGLSKVAMAERMHTTRAQLDRLLDPANPSVTLATLQRAAKAVGRHLSIALT
jgi:antitoxin HicB